MEGYICPNFETCELVIKPDFAVDGKSRAKYIIDFCRASESKRNRCKRLIMKNTYHFCPEFVLPDTKLTPDEIIDKFEELNSRQP
jgi:hypothetical protein